jgi:hypothetical protein
MPRTNPFGTCHHQVPKPGAIFVPIGSDPADSLAGAHARVDCRRSWLAGCDCWLQRRDCFL